MDSKLQIISGRWRGRVLFLPPNARPTQNMARIALFNMLESGVINYMPQLYVWDAFAGSGAFGIECLSRYVGARALFTDISMDSAQTVRKNLAMLNIGAFAEVIRTDAPSVVQRFAPVVNLVFVDPPYASANLGVAFVKKFGKVGNKGTILIWEQEAENAVEPNPKHWDVLRDKTYGRARFLILHKK